MAAQAMNAQKDPSPSLIDYLFLEVVATWERMLVLV